MTNSITATSKYKKPCVKKSVRKDSDCERLKYRISKGFRFVNLVLMACLFALLITGSVKEGFAKDKRMQQYSKDYKAYPAGSPEAVVTAFIEFADLGKGANRQDDERLSLFWSLTEQSSVPDNSQSLLIKSYEIAGKSLLPSGDAIVKLKMDVRAIKLIPCYPKDSNSVHSRYNEQINNCNWRERTVYIGDSVTGSSKRINTSNNSSFINYVFGEGRESSGILANISDIYVVPKNKREWTFEVRLIKRKNRWLISTDSIPLESGYVSKEIKEYNENVDLVNTMNDVCYGKRVLDKSIIKYYDFGDDKIIGLNLQKYKDKYCTKKYLNDGNSALKEYITTLQLLKTANGD